MDTTALLAIAAGILAFALISRRAEAGMVTAPMVFTAFGFVAGSGVLGVIDPQIQSSSLQTFAELTLVVALFTDAARIDLRRLGSEHDVPLRLLGIGLPLTVAAGTGAAMLLFPTLGLWPALLIGVILAPTDAALGQAVVSDARVPQRIRQGLNVESGLNDGIAFPALLFIASFAGGAVEDLGVGSGEIGAMGWASFILGQLILGPLVGLGVGLGGTYLITRAHAREWMNEIFLRISTLCLAIIAFTAAELVGGNGFIAAFAGGLIVGTRSRVVLEGVEDFGETEGQLLTLLVFLLFGAVLLPELESLGLRHVLYAILSLTVLRMVPVALSLVGTRMAPATVLFLGWFGPRGLASILYLLLLTESGAVPGIEEIQRVVFLTVLMSIVLHGAAAAPLAGRYGRWIKTQDDAPEHRPTFPFPVRMRSMRQKAGKT
ncbi:cation:proton antiporter [Roseicyclus sp. F158]|uniref:Cation:proton antiporter n=1 Tax=Tropicimonas omnivorans TaxID=3075590 RepID=A0ABU3DDA0_9RHOB|nr:cation:proton antiporter [Roseicyclus sp. F158]MDT0681509.1 cation:proton antiporter [Roseicyclus sp. F158]